MPEPDSPGDRPAARKDFLRQVSRKEARKLKARRRKSKAVWFGLGMFGLVGWSVALPILVCIALGIWIDKHWPGRHSWTLACLILGVVIGCINAWLWINREHKAIEKEQQEEGNNRGKIAR
ncbi:MAG: AtpZ/AtpI family protein [Deltaproteobacteria bacterium]|nr:AtpZ/AtpI family protein [Deltaproteobacteria bacterium]